MTREDSKAAERQWFALGAAFLSLYAFATLVSRGDTWGLHAFAYFAIPIRIGALSLCALLLWRPARDCVLAALEGAARPAGGRLPWLMAAALAAVVFAIFYGLPIKTEVYGDTRTILRQWADNRQLPPLQQLLDLRFYKTDAALTQILTRTVAHVFSITIEQAFRLTSALSGTLSIAVWTGFVLMAFPRSPWRRLLILAGALVGANQVFFGHVETYAFASLTVTLFLTTSYLCFKGHTPFWLVLVTFLLALKSHSIAICFLPGLLYMVAWQRSARSGRPDALAWGWVVTRVVAPFLLVGAGLYFFVFRSFAAPYTGARTGMPQTFLPLVPTAGFRDYSIFSGAHLLDLANALMLVGMPVVAVLLGLALFHRRAVNWRNPTVIFTGLTLLFTLLFLAVVNPLLSMPRDWDLYALLAAPLLLFLAATVSAADSEVVARAPLEGQVLAFGLFTAGFCVLNASPALLSPRLEQVGEHVFTTYHTSASYLILTAQGMEPDTARSLPRREATIQRLERRVLGEDQEYTHMLSALAAVYRARGDHSRAVAWARKATAVAPHDSSLSLYLADYLLWDDDSPGALQCLDPFLERHPTSYDGLVLAAVAAAKLADHRRALGYLERAQELAPNNPDVALWIANMKAKLGEAGVQPSRGSSPVAGAGGAPSRGADR